MQFFDETDMYISAAKSSSKNASISHVWIFSSLVHFSRWL